MYKMEICNNPEDFTREIQHILIFDASKFSFNQNFKALTPDINSYLLTKNNNKRTK